MVVSVSLAEEGGGLKCSCFFRIKEDSYRMETIWLFLTVLFAHSFQLFSCVQEYLYLL